MTTRVDIRDVRADLEQMYIHRHQIERNLSVFLNPFNGMKAHPLAVEGLKAELDRTDKRIQTAKGILGIRSIVER